MSIQVFGSTYTSSEFNNFSLTQKVIHNENVILRWAIVKFVVHNDPTFTDMTMKIYANNNETQGKLLYSSTTTRTKAQIMGVLNSEIHGYVEASFEFDDISLPADTPFFYSLGGSGATFTSDSMIAWAKGYPDPVYTTNNAVTWTSAAKNANYLVLAGAEF